MKFQIGDNFRVIENGLLGQIIATSFNSMHQQSEYVVKWTHHAREESYPVDECDPCWELESRTVYIKIPQAIDFIMTDIKIDTSGPIKVQCNGHHTWVEVGFHFTKEVCKYCDIEKGKS